MSNIAIVQLRFPHKCISSGSAALGSWDLCWCCTQHTVGKKIDPELTVNDIFIKSTLVFVPMEIVEEIGNLFSPALISLYLPLVSERQGHIATLELGQKEKPLKDLIRMISGPKRQKDKKAKRQKD